jgi:hypothetical protein
MWSRDPQPSCVSAFSSSCLIAEGISGGARPEFPQRMPIAPRQVAIDFNLTHYLQIVRFDEQKILFKIHPASRDRADALANLPLPGKVVSAKAGCGHSGNKTGF